MDRIARRSIIKTQSSLDTRLDCVSVLGGRVASSTVNLCYVADKMIVEPKSFHTYLEAIGSLEWSSLEEMALAILDDVNNEVVARWVQITLIASDGADNAGAAHSVIVEDRQPKWDNPALLSRLPT